MTRPLGRTAISAGVALLLAAALHALLPYLLDLPYEDFLFLLISDGVLALIALTLLLRRRTALAAALFLIAAGLAVPPIFSWFEYSDDLPYFLTSGVRAFVCLFMALVCLRRAKEPKRGAWVLVLVPQLLLLALLIVTIFIGSPNDSGPYNQMEYRQIFSVTSVAEGLMLAALALTAIAYARSAGTAVPQDDPAPQPEPVYPPEPEYVPQQSASRQPQQSASRQQQSFRQTDQQQTAAPVQEAEIEILDD